MKGERLLSWILVVLSAGFLSVPFLVPHCGFFALFGFVPLLCMNRIANLAGLRHVWLYAAVCFLLWNAATTFWVCNATVGGGIFAIVANAFQMTVIFAVFRLSERHFKGILPYILLAAMWIAWERAYYSADISWPWLTLGNAFARSTASVQWYEFTGALGGSLWVWMVNITLYRIMAALSDGSTARWNGKGMAALGLWTVLIIAGPFVLSKVMFDRYREKENPLEVIIFQPNIDPYMKFQSLSQKQQNDILVAQMEERIPERDSLDAPLLLLCPETFTSDIVVGQYYSSMTWRRFTQFLSGRPGVNMIFGASSYSRFTHAGRPSYTARQMSDGSWIESHNSALLIDGTGRTEIGHKNRLVVGVEMIPYPAVFAKVDDWLGGVMGRCVGDGRPEVFDCGSASDTVKVGCAVCYESVYGEYYTGYVLSGAEVMTIITNDAWWGDTPGYRQHLSYASLRAIETRRSIARCGNTGISGFIDQRGVLHDRSPWWESAVVSGRVNRNDVLTFFVRHGDITGRACTFVFCLLLLALAVRLVLDANARRGNARAAKKIRKKHK